MVKLSVEMLEPYRWSWSMPQQARFARGNRPAVVVQCGHVVPRVQAYYGALQPARVFLRLQNTEGKEQP